MKPHILVSVAILIVAFMTLCTAQEVDDLVAQMKSFINPNLNPCDDFYAFACGNYIKEHPVPANYTNKNESYVDWPVQQALADHVQDKLREIVKQPFPIVHDFYQSCDRSKTDLNNELNAVFGAYRSVIASLTQDLRKPEDVASLLAKLGVFEAFLSVGETITISDGVTTVGASFSPRGTFYYSPEDYRNKATYDALLGKLTALFASYSKNASSEAVDVINVEIHIVDSSGYNSNPPLTIENATKLTGFDWLTFTKEQKFPFGLQTRVFLNNETYFRTLNSYIRALPEVTLQRYLEWRVYTFLNRWNYPNFCEVNDQWDPERCEQNQEDFCILYTSFFLNDLVNLLYGESTINAKSRDSLLNMTTFMELSFNDNLSSRPWLDSDGVEAARYKLMLLLRVIGTPDILVRNYDGIVIRPDQWFTNIINIYAVASVWFATQIYEPFNRTKLASDSFSKEATSQQPSVTHRSFSAKFSENFATVHTAVEDSARYRYTENYLWYPAASVESTFYRAEWPKLFQFAGLGAVAAGELAHGFDTNGMYYNGTGQYGQGPIYDGKTVAALRNQSRCVINQYDNYKAVGNISINGQATLNNNLADLAGVKTAYRAYQSYVALYGKEFPDGALIPGFSTNQIHFLFSAQTLCSVENKYYLEQSGQYITPNKWRVNGVASQLTEFAEAFKCPVGSPMNSAVKCHVW